MAHAFCLYLQPTLDELPSLRDCLRTWLQAQTDVAEDAREDVVLACWEAARNAIEHSGTNEAPIRVTVERRGDAVVACVADTGRWLEPEPREDRGLGLRLIAMVTDAVHIRRSGAGTRLLMCRSLAPRPQ